MNKIESAVKMSSMDFRFSLARSMIRNFCNRKRALPKSRPSKRSKGENDMVVDHLPEFAETRSRCAFCATKKVENRTYVRCISCNAALCLQKDRNCFYQYHTAR